MRTLPGSLIDYTYSDALTSADRFTFVRMAAGEIANDLGMVCSFMPKPLYDEPGNGMHFHIQLRKKGRNVFYDADGYAGLSETALCFIGGILAHGRSLTAFTNPSTNSYKRLLPGFEAPVKLFFGVANRSLSEPASGYVYLNDVQLGGVKKDKGVAQRVVDLYLSFDTELKKIVAPLGRSTSLPIGMSDALGIDDPNVAQRLKIKYVV